MFVRATSALQASVCTNRGFFQMPETQRPNLLRVAHCVSRCFIQSVSYIRNGETKAENLNLVVEVVALCASRVSRDLLVVTLESREILTSLGELTLLHTLTHIPVDESALGVHQVKLGIDAREDLSDGSRVGQHADSTLNLGHLGTRNDGGRLRVDTALEASGAPVDELDGGLLLDGGQSVGNVLGKHITTVHQTAGHVLAATRISLAERVLGLKGGVGDLSNGVLLMEGLISGDDRRVRGQQEVDARVGNQVGLELIQVHVQRALEAERAGEGGDNLSDEAVQVVVVGTRDVQSAVANVVDGLVVQHEGAVSVLQQRVSGENRVVGLNNGGGDLRRRVDAEVELGLLAVINGQALQQERAETRSSTTTNRVEDPKERAQRRVRCEPRKKLKKIDLRT